jgi:hypothetical protein
MCWSKASLMKSARLRWRGDRAASSSIRAWRVRLRPPHYLALLEQKPGAIDWAAPLQGWTLPESLRHLRRLLEARMGRRGKREFIQVLRLMEVFPQDAMRGISPWNSIARRRKAAQRPISVRTQARPPRNIGL